MRFHKLVCACVALAGSLAGPLHAQNQPRLAGVLPVKPGEVMIVATYLNASGKLVADTTRIVVLPVAIATIELFNTFNPPGWITNVTIGKPFCAYAQAKDAAGNILTGRPVVFTSLDPLIAAITPSTVCPDTTINAALITANVLPPLTAALNKK